MIVTLLGFMGSGKSSMGKMIADNLGYNCIDLDIYIVDQEQMKISEIFKQKGEAHFRELESKYLKELISRHHNLVLPLGGGTPCNEENWQFIKQTKSFYIKKTVDELYVRLYTRRSKRPLIAPLSDKELKAFIEHRMKDRSPFYERADHIIEIKAARKDSVNYITDIIQPPDSY